MCLGAKETHTHITQAGRLGVKEDGLLGRKKGKFILKHKEELDR
jgi:hypothetical protein